MNAYVLNDEDYKSFTKDLSIKNYNNSILFNVDKDTYAFANDLKKEIIKRTSKEMGMFSGYDEYVKNVMNQLEENILWMKNIQVVKVI
ncbi:hypothetical protein Q0Y04_04695 [Clostridioides difficile]|nr:hypothetical protein Q0Y04_04695 [Clostridioides difficile]